MLRRAWKLERAHFFLKWAMQRDRHPNSALYKFNQGLIRPTVRTIPGLLTGKSSGPLLGLGSGPLEIGCRLWRYGRGALRAPVVEPVGGGVGFPPAGFEKSTVGASRAPGLVTLK